MKKRPFTLIIIVVAALSVTGILLLQFSWLKESKRDAKLFFKQRASEMASSVAGTIESSDSLKQPLKRLFSGNPISIADSLMLSTNVNSIIDNGLKDFGTHTATYGIYFHNMTSGEYNYKYGNNFGQRLTAGKIEGMGIIHNRLNSTQSGNKHLDILVDFIGEKPGYWSHPSFAVISSFLLVIILAICFYLTLSVVFKQKRVALIKNDFINNLTHEFKTPIFSIGLAAKMLKLDAVVSKSANAASLISSIERENNKLSLNTDQILQLALIDNKGFSLDKKSVDLHALLLKAINNFELQLNENNIELNSELNALNSSINADAIHLQNALGNLIDNAIKYRSSEVPLLYIATYNTSKKEIVLIIRDNGIGIDSQGQKFIFEKFYREPTGDLHDIKGFGLGLNYVREIFKAHNITISLKSGSGKGTEFKISIPTI